MKLTGHATPFNSMSVDLGGFREIVKPGAFGRTISDGHPIFAVHSHNFAQILGSNQSGALVLSEDSYGLRFELDLPDTSLARDVHALVARGDLSHMSFSFSVPNASGEHWRELSDGTFERTLLDVDLYEISTVALPAYRRSKVSARTESGVAARTAAGVVRRRMQVRLAGLKVA